MKTYQREELDSWQQQFDTLQISIDPMYGIPKPRKPKNPWKHPVRQIKKCINWYYFDGPLPELRTLAEFAK